MKSHAIAGSFGLATILLAHLPIACHAAITYQMLPQVAQFDGWTFDGGFVTTDGSLGEIGPNNFLDWSIGFTSPSGEYVIEAENGVAYLTSEVTMFVDTNGIQTVEYGEPLALVATAKHLTIPPVALGDDLIFVPVILTRAYSVSFPGALVFSNEDDFGSPTSPGFGVTFSGTSHGSIPQMAIAANMFTPRVEGPLDPNGTQRWESSPFIVPGTEFAIASVTSVPEPGLSAFFGIAILGSASIHRRNHR